MQLTKKDTELALTAPLRGQPRRLVSLSEAFCKDCMPCYPASLSSDARVLFHFFLLKPGFLSPAKAWLFVEASARAGSEDERSSFSSAPSSSFPASPDVDLAFHPRFS